MKQGDFEIGKIAAFIIILILIILLIAFAMKITTVRSIFLRLFP